jgi:pyruvate carboxylase subunit B
LCNVSHEVFVEQHGNRYYVVVEGNRYEALVEDEALRRTGRPSITVIQAEGRTSVTSPMPGIVVAILVQEGEYVQAGDGVAILEAMKMENEIRAPYDGVVQSVHAAPGQTVNQNEILITIGAPDESSD